MSKRLSLAESLQTSIALHPDPQQNNRDESKPLSKTKEIGLKYQLALCAIFFGSQSSVEFESVYSVLSLQYFGLPVSLVSVSGIASGIFGIFFIPNIGAFSDRGSSPKRRKVLILLLALCFLMASYSILIVCSILKTQEVKSELGTSHDNDSTPTNSNTSTDSTDTTDATSSIPIAASLAIFAFVCLDIGFDISLSLPRGLIVECVPPEQKKRVFVTGTMFSGFGGILVGFLGILNLPEYLGPVFHMDGMSATLILLCACFGILSILTFGSTFLTVAILNRKQKQTGTEKQRLLSHDDSNSSRLGGDDHSTVNPYTDFGAVDYGSTKTPQDSKLGKEERSKHGFDIVEESFETKTPLDSNLFNSNSLSRSGNAMNSLSTKDEKTLKEWSFMGYTLNRYFFLTFVSSFLSFGANLCGGMYSSNTLTLEVFKGDPRALPDTVEREQYEKGIRMSSFGYLSLGVAYLLTSFLNRKLFDKIDNAALLALSSSVLATACALFYFLKSLGTYFFMMVSLGTFKSMSHVIPFVLGLKYFRYKNSSSSSKNGDEQSNPGRVTSLIGCLLPFHFMIVSTFMGPAMDAAGNAWPPIIYLAAVSAVNALISGLLLIV